MDTFDELLSEKLRAVAGDFALSPGARELIMDRALDDPLVATPTHRWPRLSSGRHQHLAAAAVVVLVACGIAIPLVKGPAGSARQFGASRKISVSSPGSAPGNHQIAGAGAGSVADTYDEKTGTFGTTGATSLSVSASTSSSSSSTTTLAKVEATGTVLVTVGRTDLESSLSSLSAIALGDGGYVATDKAHLGTESSASSYATIVLAVPEARFSTLVTQVQRIGTVTSVATSAKDVTSQYVDLQARIGALEASRTQYLAIMARATTIPNILAVQSQIDTLQSEIEQYQGELKVLTNETTYGTLRVELSVVGHHGAPGRAHRSGVVAAWDAAVGGFVAGFEWLIRVSGPLLFGLILALGLLGGLRWGWRIRRERTI